MQTIYSSGLSPFGSVPENISISQLLVQYNPEAVEADKTVHTDDISPDPLTYGSLRRDAGRVAWGLRHKLGLRHGDAILTIAPNSNDFLRLAHGTWWAGGVFAPLSTAATQSDVEHAISLIKPTHIAVMISKVDVVNRAIESMKSNRPMLITMVGRAGSHLQFPTDTMGKSDSESLPPFDLGDRSSKNVPCVICFSSGTTGKTKGVQLSHHNLVANALQTRAGFPSRSTSTVKEVWFTPYCHIYGLFTVAIYGMWLGGYYHGLREFNLQTFCDKASAMRATDMHIVPPVALLLATSPVSKKSDLSSLKRILVAAAPLKTELQTKLKARFPQVVVTQGYGLSETSPSVALQLEHDEALVGSVGKLLPGTEVRLVDPETLKDVPPHQEGEIWVRGPQVMMGYINDEHATKQTFVDGWLRTGDIGKMTADHNLWITDRFKEIYHSSQVGPSELEDLLLKHPAVVDAAVCSVYNDAEATEVPLAYVSLEDAKVNLPAGEKAALLEGIRSWADGNVASYKRLRGGVHHLQVLPKNPTGKIMRRMLPAKLKEARAQKL